MRRLLQGRTTRVAVVLGAAILAGAGIDRAQRSGAPQHWIHTPEAAEAGALAPSEGGKGERADELRARERWFYRQRAYPNKVTPAGALAHAAAQARAVKTDAAVAATTATAPTLPWTAIGPKPIGSSTYGNDRYMGNRPVVGRVTALVPVGDGTTAYLGAANGGVWKTTNGGSSWAPVFDSAIAAGQTGMAIGAIAVDASNTNTIYVGTGEANLSGDSYFGGGVFKSTDGGTSWAKVGGATMPDRCHVSDIKVRGTTIIAALERYGRYDPGCNAGIYRSTDGGATWTRRQAPLSNGSKVGAFDIAAGGANTWYATFYFDGVYKSTDDGVTWKLTNPTTGSNAILFGTYGRPAIAVAPSDPNWVYLVVSSPFSEDFGNVEGMFVSSNGGTNWTPISPPLSPDGTGGLCNFEAAGDGQGQCWYDEEVVVDPNSASTVYMAGTTLWKSVNGGVTWSRPGFDPNESDPNFADKAIHVDFHALAFDSASTPRLWAGNDGGAYRTADGGSSWTNLNSTLSIAQFEPGISGLAVSGGPIFGGTQDDGTSARTTSDSWQQIFGGDGGATAWDPADPNTIYVSYVYSNFYKSTDGGTNFVDATNGIDQFDPVEFYAPLIMDPANRNRLYFGTNRVWRTTNAASSWSPISDEFLGTITTIAPASADTVYAGTSEGELEVTTNAAAGTPTWTDTAATPLPNRVFTDIEAKPGSPGRAYVTASGFDPDGGNGHVFMTRNFGATWTNVSGNLPNTPVNAIAVDWRTSPETLYAGTDVGVFWSSDGGTTWNNTSTGLPPTIVMDLKLDTAVDKLIAATHGRGMFSAPAVLGPTHAVTVVTSGNGSGTVTSDFDGINCGSTCTHAFLDGATITLTATPGADSNFSGWSGDCSGTGTCRLTVDADKNVTATFAKRRWTLSVGRAGTGGGVVTGAGIDCGANCSGTYDHGTLVSLTASPDASSHFDGWSGACSGTAGCAVTMDSAKEVTATFTANPPPPTPCNVPNVTGLSLGAAQTALLGANCSLGGVASAYSKTVKKGAIISQSSPAGTQLASGAAISVVVSKGPIPKKRLVLMCRKGRTVRVPASQVKKLRKHGAKLGACKKPKRKRKH